MAEQISSARAEARTVRIAPRKARLVVDLIRGKDVAEALAILEFTPRAKRFRPRAKGMASPINKRTSHVVVVVSEKND